MSKNYNDIFLNITINKKNGYENSNPINQNLAQSYLALKNLNLREDLFNYYMRNMENLDTKTNLKHRKIKDKKAKIKKFSDENKNQEQINHIQFKRNKIKNNKDNFDEISLDKYKMYLNALFNENNNKSNDITKINNNKMNNIHKINNNYSSPSNNTNHSFYKKMIFIIITIIP